MSFNVVKDRIEGLLEDLEQEYESSLDEIADLHDIIKELERENELLKEKISALEEAFK